MLEVGKLYSCSGYYLMLYPDKETAEDVASRASAVEPVAAIHPAEADDKAAYWTRVHGKPVSYCEHETPLLVLSVNEKSVEVLAGDMKGWIIYRDWLELEEIR